MRASTLITGVGTLGAWGFGRRSLLDALRAGEALSLEVPEARAGARRHHAARRGGLLPENDFSEWIPRRASRRMSRPSKMAVAAARLAVEDALLEDAPGALEGTAVVLGTAFGPAEFTERLLEELFEEPQQASPFLFSECVANAPAGQVGIALGASGPNTTITQREASGLLSVIEAASLVQRGKASRALAGSSEELTPLMLAILDRFGALARDSGGLDERPRPFDAERNGFLFGEGSTIVVVESEDAARERGAPRRARIRGSIRANDPAAPAWGWSRDPSFLAERLARGLEGLDLSPADIELVVSGASGSVPGDAIEAGVLRRVWGETLPPIVAPKGVAGEYSGAQLAAAVFCTEYRKTFPTAGFASLDPACSIEPCRELLLLEGGPVLVSSLAAGGPSAWLVLEPCD